MKRLRVLVVDDEEALRLTISANLELEGFTVTAASGGTQALDLIEQGEPFDLVLSDIRMSGMDGVTLFRQIRRLRPDMPVILMTAFALEGLVQEALQEGAFALLPKPFEIDHLVSAITRAARRPVVLIVDDVKAVADTTAAALCTLGVHAMAVSAPRDALDLVAAGKVDVCVIDLIMPELDGPALIEAVHEIDRQVVCIAVSGQEVDHLFRRIAAHVQTFMQKPLDPRVLARTIARARGIGGNKR